MYDRAVQRVGVPLARARDAGHDTLKTAARGMQVLSRRTRAGRAGQPCP